MDDNSINFNILEQIKELMDEMSSLGLIIIILLSAVLISGIIALVHFW